LTIKAERGYIIPALGAVYVECAHRLAASIKQFHPTADITIIDRDLLPCGDQGGYANDWQMFQASPYRQTIKLEADMICASPIDHWWTLFELRDVVISQGCRDFYDQPAISRHYRQIFDRNDLPDVYNAVTYWRRSQTAQQFFYIVKIIFENWGRFRSLLQFSDEEPTTDVVYAMVASYMGTETVTLPRGLGPTIVHMKKHMIGTLTDDWTKELVWEENPFRINTVAQWGLVHYHIKEWCNE
jgi:hypothetical protein